MKEDFNIDEELNQWLRDNPGEWIAGIELGFDEWCQVRYKHHNGLTRRGEHWDYYNVPLVLMSAKTHFKVNS